MERSKIPVQPASRDAEPTVLTTPALIGEIGSKAVLLVTKEIELAKREMKEDLRAEIAAIKSAGVAVIAGIMTLNLLCITAVFALSAHVTPVIAALVATAIFLLITLTAAAYAWKQRVTEPLDLTRESVEEDVKFAKEQIS